MKQGDTVSDTQDNLVAELKKENDLLLLQLHNVQEELEEIYLHGHSAPFGQAGWNPTGRDGSSHVSRLLRMVRKAKRTGANATTASDTLMQNIDCRDLEQRNGELVEENRKLLDGLTETENKLSEETASRQMLLNELAEAENRIGEEKASRQMLEEELVRLAAQIDLLKDMVLSARPETVGS
jgi:hypothetical protein